MEMTDILYYADEAIKRLKVGINKVANAVKVTMGPGGRTVILGDPGGLPIVTKDGVTVAKYIKLIDPIENMGAQLLRQAAGKTVTDAGDGTTTSTVLAQSLINYSGTINNATSFRKGMEAATEEVITYLELNKAECTNEHLYNIALTSSNGDGDIAEKVAEVASQVGKDGIIEVKPSEFDKTSYQIEDGYRFDRGLPSSSFINEGTRGSCEMDGGGMVVCIEDKIDHFKNIKPLIIHANNENKFLIIIAKEFEPAVISDCQKNFKGKIRVVPVVAPGFGDQMLANLEDISLYCDTEVISQAQLKAGEGKIGMIDEVKITKGFTNLKSESAPGRVAVRLKQLSHLITEATTKFDQDKIKDRISKLSAGFGIIKVGGTTPAEISERFDRYEDAVGAVMASLRHGILPGGGAALLHAENGIKVNLEESVDFIDGWNNVMRSLAAPYSQIALNADVKPSIPVGEIKFHTGYDVVTGEWVNMYDLGIIDPYKVTISALTNAVSVASMILTTGCVIDSHQINVKM